MENQDQMSPFKDVVIFDIDGTLANGEHRQKYVREKPKNWMRYNDLMHLDTVHEHVKLMYQYLHRPMYRFIVSGREDRYRQVTEKWLTDNQIIDWDGLFMRKAGDYRSDDIVKEEIFNTYFGNMKERILCVFDDRPRVIRMWRKIGIPVFDCGLGVEF